jgi:hypothetical protein
MRSARRTFTIDIPIPIPVFNQLCDHLDRGGRKQELSEVAGMAIREWLQSADHAPVDVSLILSGYQWKDLFLPSGTVLRTVFKGHHYQATVQENVILFDGRHVSPSEFVNTMGGSSRNAWRALWLLFPNEKIWRLAAACRDSLDQTCRRPRRPRKRGEREPAPSMITSPPA